MPGISGNGRIGIFGHVGNRNLGDEAIIAAVLHNIRHRNPGLTICGYTTNPEDTENRYNIKSFPIRRNDKRPHPENTAHLGGGRPISESSEFLGVMRKAMNIVKKTPIIYPLLKGVKRILYASLSIIKEIGFIFECYRRLEGVDLLIVAGSQQLIDFIGGPWGHPYTIFRWSVLAKIRKTKVAFLSVGAGPINSLLSKFFFRYSLSNAVYRSYRDESSLKLIQSIGINGRDFVLPDLAHSIKIGKENLNKVSYGSNPVVGINPVPYSDPVYWPGSSPKIYEKYVNSIAEFAVWLIKKGYRVLLFPTQLILDPPVIRDIRTIMENRIAVELKKNILEGEINSLDDLVEAINSTAMVVATRFHGIVISFVLNKPVLGIAYHKKTLDLMESLGQSEYVLDICDIETDSLKKRFDLLEANAEIIRKRISTRSAEFHNLLDVQFDRVLENLELNGAKST